MLVELWAGVSGLAVAMLALGMSFYGAAAEMDLEAAACARTAMPQLVHYDRVEDVSAKHFQGLLARRRPRAVILGGGSPCQGNSVLNKSRRGLSDDRSLQPAQLKRLKAEFEENVASMPADVA